MEIGGVMLGCAKVGEMGYIMFEDMLFYGSWLGTYHI